MATAEVRSQQNFRRQEANQWRASVLANQMLKSPSAGKIRSEQICITKLWGGVGKGGAGHFRSVGTE